MAWTSQGSALGYAPVHMIAQTKQRVRVRSRRHAVLFDGLPRDTGALAKTVQGLLIHQHIAPAYGVTLSRD